jgi:hypothetical protein
MRDERKHMQMPAAQDGRARSCGRPRYDEVLRAGEVERRVGEIERREV